MAAASAAIWCANAATVTVSSVSQRWPWNKQVDVTYSVSGATAPIDIDVSITSNGKTVQVPDGAISGTARSVTDGGPYRLTFDPTRTAFSNETMLADCTVTLTPALEKLYMLVNLAMSGNTAARVTYTNEVIGTGTQWNDLYKTNYIVLKRIPAGTFTMGRSRSPGSGYGHEAPQHQVTLTKDFYIGVYELTLGQFMKAGGSFPIKSTDSYFTDMDPLRPAHCLRYYTLRSVTTWSSTNDLAVARDCGSASSYWLGKLREKTGGGFLFDLPTEAQWEYACHAGTSGDFYTGENVTAWENEDPKLANYARYRWNGGYPDGVTSVNYAWTAAEGGPAHVGSYEPNNWGLYDMLGNMLEWCLDSYTGGTLGSAPSVDPRGGADCASDTLRMMKGGAWNTDMRQCRTTFRGAANPGNFAGCRLCLTLE